MRATERILRKVVAMIDGTRATLVGEQCNDVRSRMYNCSCLLQVSL